MPLYEFKCEDCGKLSEILVLGRTEAPECISCGSKKLTKLISAHSSMSGPSKMSMPGSGDKGCCGLSPGEKSGCAGPGSCCGKQF